MGSRFDAAHSIIHRTGVPNGWRESLVGDLASIIGGGTPDRRQAAYWREGSIPWITPTDISANGSKYIARGVENISELGLQDSNATLVPENSTVFSTRGTVGSIALARNPLACNQSCEVLVPRSGKVDAEFLFYLLTFGRSAFIRLSGGTTFGAITRRDIANVRFALPSRLEEQAAIARILDAVDTTIERTHEAVKRTRDLEQSVLEKAFRNLVAEPRRLGEFIVDVRYGTSKASNEKGRGNAALRIPNVVGNRLALDDVAYVDLPSSEVERLQLGDGDLLLVRTNGNPSYVGRSVVFRRPDARIWVYASYLIRVRVRNRILPDYVNVFLGLERGRRELLRRVTTSAGNHNINSNSIRLIRIAVPVSRNTQEQIVELAKGFRLLIDSLEAKARALSNLKRSLMHDLLTGKVRVGDVSKAFAS